MFHNIRAMNFSALLCVGLFVNFCLVGAQPTPSCSFARHWVGKIVIQIAHLLYIESKPVMFLVGFLDSHRWLPSAIPGLVEYIVFARNAGRQDSKYEQKEISLYKSDSSRIVEFIGKLVNLCLFLCFFAFFSTFFSIFSLIRASADWSFPKEGPKNWAKKTCRPPTNINQPYLFTVPIPHHTPNNPMILENFMPPRRPGWPQPWCTIRSPTIPLLRDRYRWIPLLTVVASPRKGDILIWRVS